MKIGKYLLANSDKVERAIHGTVGAQGQLVGGVGEKAKPAVILAEYDRLGGLIMMDGKYKVKTGSFYNIKGKAAHAKPKPKLLFNVNGETIEIDADKPLPLEVQAAEQANERKAARRAKKVAAAKGKKGGKKAAKEDDEDESDDEDTDEDDEDEDGEGELA